MQLNQFYNQLSRGICSLLAFAESSLLAASDVLTRFLPSMLFVLTLRTFQR